MKSDYLELPPIAAQYLLTQRMVIRVSGGQEEVTAEPPPTQKPIVVDLPEVETLPIVEAELNLEPKNESSPDKDLESSFGDEEILQFLNTASASDIEAVRHIGKRTANEIIEARPITWDDAQTLLTERQIEALVSHQNQA